MTLSLTLRQWFSDYARGRRQEQRGGYGGSIPTEKIETSFVEGQPPLHFLRRNRTCNNDRTRMMFRGKQRPHDLVFSSCERCNSGTKRSDLVASLLGRVYPDGTDLDTADLRKVLQAVANNVPGLLQEMMLSDAERAAAKMPVGWALRASGPILTSHILTFGAKLGLALHFELHKRPVPISGVVLPIWFSNAQAVRGEIPANLLAMLPAHRTMTQGKQHVGDQFSIFMDHH
jgi:hypothetical protein